MLLNPHLKIAQKKILARKGDYREVYGIIIFEDNLEEYDSEKDNNFEDLLKEFKSNIDSILKENIFNDNIE